MLVLVPFMALAAPTTSRGISRLFHVSDQLCCGHVSTSSKDIAVLAASGIFIWIPGFERLIHREVTLNDTATVLNFNASRDNIAQDISVYLALGESNEKAAIATRKGLFIVSLDPETSKLTAEAPPRPGVSVCRVAKYDHSRHLSFISCLQMTDTGLFFNWCPSLEQSRPSEPARRMMVIPPPPPPQHGHVQVPIQIVPSPRLSLSMYLFKLCRLLAWRGRVIICRGLIYHHPALATPK
ncbi:hypothetical protein BDR05DRAFT_1060161 [Suillus weaverae]|nr:hypothetical protein BDR05DRAFT_1060161 [Suillus weaverae]